MDEKNIEENITEDGKSDQQVVQGSGDSSLSEPEQTTEKVEEKKKDSEFPGQEIEQPSLKETTPEKTEEVENVKPIIIEWKKPFFLMFGIGVAGIVLMLILK